MSDFKDFENPWSADNSEWFNEERNKWFYEDDNQALESNSISNVDLNRYKEIAVSNRKMIVVVIDPGHGNTTGNTGATYIKAYKHKIKDDNGEPKKDPDGNDIIRETLIQDLDSYLKEEVTKKETDWKWLTKRIYDNSLTERDLVWDVSVQLNQILNNLGYTSLLTRNSKIINGDDNRAARCNISNNNRAHYFISVHADGSLNYDASGSHSIYRISEDENYNSLQFEFAKDILYFYNVVQKTNTPIVKNTDLQVLSPKLNNAFRKTLVELGFMTNPNDVKLMMDKIQIIAEQIVNGLERNISKVYYKIEEVITAYDFNGKRYTSKETAYYAYNLEKFSLFPFQDSNLKPPIPVKSLEKKFYQPANL